MGENWFGVTQESSRLIADFSRQHGQFAVEQFDGEDSSFDTMQAAVESSPFLTAKKLVVLRSPSVNKEFTDKVEQLIGAVQESTDLLILEQRLDKRTSYYKYIKTKLDPVEFNPLDDSALVKWLIARSRELGGELSPGNARYLLERVGLDQYLLSNDLDKLLAHNPQVTQATIDLLCEPAPQSTVFQLLEAAFGGRLSNTLELYQEQRSLKVEPQQIVAMVIWQLYILVLVKFADGRDDATIAKDSRLNPFVVRKSRALANKFTGQQLKSLVRSVLKLDTDLKSQSIDIDGAVQLWLMRLAS